MKILTYNIHRCNQEKIDSILKRGADIMVLPECACPDQVSLPDGYDMPFFIDFTFTNIPLFAYMIGGWERNMSDHKPQIIVI